MRHREQEAKQLDTQKHRLFSRRQQARRNALARATRIRTLLRKLGQSTKRCTCHDFDCWAPLWKIDAALALELCASGFHFYDCVLAPYDCQRGRVWDIKRPRDHPFPRPPLILSSAAVLGASSAEQEVETDEDEASEQESETCSDEEADEEDGSEQGNGVQDASWDPISDVMLACGRRRLLLRLAALSCAMSMESNGGIVAVS